MKKRILSMLLVATMVMGIFTGCGAGGSANTITVSEMLNSILEEEGEVVMYRMVLDGDKWSDDYSPSKNTKVFYEYYNGKTITTMIPSKTGEARNPLGDYLDGTYVADAKHTNSANWDMPNDLTVITDEDNNVLCEILSGTTSSSIHFGSFERKEINGVSCMVFATYQFSTENNGDWAGHLSEVYYTIIKDTDYTKDKTVVLDSVGTENTKEEKWKSTSTTIKTSDKDWKPNK